MEFSVQDSFDQHSPNYSARVTDRESYFGLSKEDDVIVSFLSKYWPEGQAGILLDAACGSGDRLRMLYEQNSLPRSNFSKIIGTDFSSGMLKIAAQQKLNDEKLYDELHLVDLLQKPNPPLAADLILCLWEVTNATGLEARSMAANLALQLNDGGFLIYDLVTTKILADRKRAETEVLALHPELEVDADPQMTWYSREDGTYSRERLFAPREVNDLLAASGLETVEVWSFNSDGPQQLQVENNQLNEQEIAGYAKIVVMQRK